MSLRMLVIYPLHPAPKWRQASFLAAHFSVGAFLDSSEPQALGPVPHHCCFTVSRVEQNSQGKAGFGTGLPRRFPYFHFIFGVS